MNNYDKLQNNLNQHALYLLMSIKRDYGQFLVGTSKEKLMNKLIQSGNLVVIDSLAGDNKIHINPHHILFQKKDYQKIKTYFETNFILEELLHFFITLSISDSELKEFEEINREQEFRLFLRKGFIEYISKEFCGKNRLTCPNFSDEVPLDFINYLEDTYDGFFSIKNRAFSTEYLDFTEKFYEQTGDNILEVYNEFMNNKMDDLEKFVKTGR